MAVRCTSSEVLAIMSVTEVPDNADLSVFINIVSTMVDDIEALNNAKMTDSRLKSLEMYLSAHFAALRYKHATETKIGDKNAQDKFGYMIGEGYKATVYGQMALKLDTTKTLESENMTKYRFDISVPEREEWVNM